MLSDSREYSSLVYTMTSLQILSTHTNTTYSWLQNISIGDSVPNSSPSDFNLFHVGLTTPLTWATSAKKSKILNCSFPLYCCNTPMSSASSAWPSKTSSLWAVVIPHVSSIATVNPPRAAPMTLILRHFLLDGPANRSEQSPWQTEHILNIY